MIPKPAVLSWSGGKDCALSLERVRTEGRFDVTTLLTTITEGLDRVSVHGVRRSLLRRQADAAGIRLVEVELPEAPSNAVYEDVFRRALGALRAEQPGLNDIVFGDIFLADVREYRERLARSCGLAAHFPLWGADSALLAGEIIDRGIGARIVCVDTHALDGSLVGREFDRALIEELPDGVDPCGERGEFHTFVTSAPFMRGAISCTVGETTLLDGRFVRCDLVPQPD